jgi:hypothetical protein
LLYPTELRNRIEALRIKLRRIFDPLSQFLLLADFAASDGECALGDSGCKNTLIFKFCNRHHY